MIHWDSFCCGMAIGMTLCGAVAILYPMEVAWRVARQRRRDALEAMIDERLNGRKS